MSSRCFKLCQRLRFLLTHNYVDNHQSCIYVYIWKQKQPNCIVGFATLGSNRKNLIKTKIFIDIQNKSSSLSIRTGEEKVVYILVFLKLHNKETLLGGLPRSRKLFASKFFLKLHRCSEEEIHFVPVTFFYLSFEENETMCFYYFLEHFKWQ